MNANNFDESKICRDHGRFATKGYADAGQVDLGVEVVQPTHDGGMNESHRKPAPDDIVEGATFVRVSRNLYGPSSLKEVTVARVTKTQFTLDNGERWSLRRMEPQGDGATSPWRARVDSLCFADDPEIGRIRDEIKMSRLQGAVVGAVDNWRARRDDPETLRELKQAVDALAELTLDDH